MGRLFGVETEYGLLVDGQEAGDLVAADTRLQGNELAIAFVVD